MNDQIKVSACFANEAFANNGQLCVKNPLSVITVLYLPTLFTVSVLLTVSGFTENSKPYVQITLRRKDNGHIVYQTEQQQLQVDGQKYPNPYNAILALNIINYPLNETTDGEYEAVLTIIQDGQSTDFVCKQTLKIIKTDLSPKITKPQTAFRQTAVTNEPQTIVKTTKQSVQKHKWYEFWKW